MGRPERHAVLGKTTIISSRLEWDAEEIIEAYHSQSIIEHVFREMKDRSTGTWWPLNHWTDQKIRVHGLYCTIAVLLRALIQRGRHGLSIARELAPTPGDALVPPRARLGACQALGLRVW